MSWEIFGSKDELEFKRRYIVAWLAAWEVRDGYGVTENQMHDAVRAADSTWRVWVKTFGPQYDPVMKRAMDMLNMPTNSIPSLAWRYYHYLAGKVGGCMEVCITAYAHYAQAVEGLECQDSAYKIDPAGLEWFQKNKGGAS